MTLIITLLLIVSLVLQVATPSYPESTLKTSKYHVGDEVVVVANTTYHEFPIETKVMITDISVGETRYVFTCECADGEYWYLDGSEITPVALYDEPTPITDWLSEHGDPAITAAMAAVDTNPPTLPVPTYKVGDQAKVIDRECGHGFQIGDYVDVLECKGGGYDCRLTGHRDGVIWWVTDIELAPVSSSGKQYPPVGM